MNYYDTIIERIKNEIAIACKKENPNWDGESFDYGCACYKNAGDAAIAAFKELEKGGHSGMSFSITKSILHRLLDELPLTSITEEDFETEPSWGSDEKCKMYNCKRYHNLYKEVVDGKTTYHELGRTVTIDKRNPKNTFDWGLTSRIVDKMFPITMPFYPSFEPYKVYIEEYSHDKAAGDIDLFAILYVVTPKGEKVEINKFYQDAIVGWHKYSDSKYIHATTEMVEITKEKYEELKNSAQIESQYKEGDPLEIREAPCEAMDCACGG